MNWHVLPQNDTDIHEESTTCKCEPRVENVNGNMVIIHNAFDGREGLEWLEEEICVCLDWKNKKNCDGNCRT